MTFALTMMRAGILTGVLVAMSMIEAVAVAGPPSVAAAPDHGENKRCFLCHGREDFKEKVRQDGRKGLFVDIYSFAASIHGKRQCRECHADAAEIPHIKGLKRVKCTRCHYVGNVVGAPQSRRYKQYRESVHGRLAAAGDTRAPWCQDCHGTHEIRPADDPTSRVHHGNIPDDCGKCHQKERREYGQSIHAQLLAKGDDNAPVCTDCHSEHSIMKPDNPASTVYASRIPENCARCHENGQLMKRYGINAQQIATFKSSFHGVALKFGVMRVANCTSCHNAHKVLPPEDPASTVNPANLPKTCGKATCHPGATANFARGKLHISAHEESAGNVYMVATAFKWLTILVMAGLVLHILLDLGRHLINRRRRRRGGKSGVHAAIDKHPEIADRLEQPFTRLDLFVRIQHACMAVSVILLAITGIPVKFHETAWAASVMNAVGGLEVTAWVHRLAATILIAVSGAHVVYISLTRAGRRNFREMLPALRDIRDLLHNILYFMGFREHRPFFGRFSYLEKFDYWAVYWGIVVMVGSGLVLWFETFFMQVMPKEMVDIAKEMHSDEAMLATLAIVIWHFYNAHFNPDK
ncbi:MAG: hypothetical protein GXP54_11545, partial [Deltaproteobacteria bacterium]|nr:hypothetical protein [Deltaproteobacteria bacterium]